MYGLLKQRGSCSPAAGVAAVATPGVIVAAARGGGAARRRASRSVLAAAPCLCRSALTAFFARCGVPLLYRPLTRFNDVGHVEEFHEVLPSLLKVSGIYSFFNGMCPENVFFQGVAAEVIKRKLAARGLSAEFLSVEIEVDESAWEGVGYKYFTDNTYYLPVIQWEVAGSVGADKDDGSAGAGAEYME